jgi:hypothetical protein
MYTLKGEAALGRDDFLKTVLEPTFFSNGSVPELDSYCPTSNCTWEPFQTLGVCGTCDDSIQQELSFGCYEHAADWVKEVDPANVTSFINITACGYWVNASSPSRVLMSGYSVDPVTNLPEEALEMRILPLVDEMTRAPAYGDGSLRFKNVRNPIVDFFVVGASGGRGSVYQNVTPIAHECVLQWCVQTVETSAYWGKLSQNITSTWQEEKPAGNDEYSWNVIYVDGEMFDYTYERNISLTPPEQAQNAYSALMPNITFSIDNTTVLQTVFLMDDFAPLLVSLDSASAQAQVKYEIPEYAGFRTREISENPWMNMTEHIQTLAQIMSAAMRISTGNTGQIDIMNGTAWDLRVHVEIRWPWIIMPLVLLGLSLIFLVATVIKSSKEESLVGIFKTSALAILFNVVGDEVQRSVGPNCRMGQARAKARELQVRLVPE